MSQPLLGPSKRLRAHRLGKGAATEEGVYVCVGDTNPLVCRGCKRLSFARGAWAAFSVFLFFRKVLEKVLEKNQTASGVGALPFMQTMLPVTASFARPDDPEAVSYGRCSLFHGPTHTHTLGCTCRRQAGYVGAFASTFTSAEALRQKYSTHHRLSTAHILSCAGKVTRPRLSHERSFYCADDVYIFRRCSPQR